MYVYVLRLEMYDDWACENGACDLIGVYSDRKKAVDKLEELLLMEEEEQHVLGIYDSVKDYMDTLREIGDIYLPMTSPIYIDVYQNLESYNNGFNEGCYVLEKIMIK